MAPALDPDAISNFLAEQRDEAPEDLQEVFLTIEDQWEQKLWHQLTDTLLDYFSKPESAPHRLPLFNTFVLTFSEKINQLKFVRLGLSASSQCKGMHGAQILSLHVLTTLQMIPTAQNSRNPWPRRSTSLLQTMPIYTPRPSCLASCLDWEKYHKQERNSTLPKRLLTSSIPLMPSSMHPSTESMPVTSK